MSVKPPSGHRWEIVHTGVGKSSSRAVSVHPSGALMLYEWNTDRLREEVVQIFGAGMWVRVDSVPIGVKEETET